MIKLKTIIWCLIAFCLIGCQSQPEILFEDIIVGDNLEACLAKGTVQYNPDYNKKTTIENDISKIELANNYISDCYFTNSEVKFDKNDIIKEIVLKFQQDKKSTGKTAKEVYNYMTQYFCQRYQNMRTMTINEEIADKNYDKYSVKFMQEGLANIWETDRVKITLKSYDNTLLERNRIYKTLNSEPFSVIDSLKWWDIDSKEGKWVELRIFTK